jgi:hypothetical protein
MAETKVKYKCAMTGITYELNWHIEPENLPTFNERKEQYPCPHCGAKHFVFVTKAENN